jgi:hypothetical protein
LTLAVEFKVRLDATGEESSLETCEGMNTRDDFADSWVVRRVCAAVFGLRMSSVFFSCDF